MSFSLLVQEHCEKRPDRIEAWEKAVLDLQVVLAYSDGVLAPAERMTLSLLSVAKRDERENRRLVDRLVRSIEQDGLAQAAEQVVRDLGALLDGETAAVRATLAAEILRESVAIMVADDVISDKEKVFLCERLAPGLGVDAQQAQDVLKAASGRLSRSRAYAERGFECYLMLADLDDGLPRLNGVQGEVLPGFLGAVDAFVVRHRIGSSRVAAYYLGALGGIFWVDAYEQHLSALGQLAVAARNLTTSAGAEGRLRAIHHELGQLRNRGVDANGYRAVARHVTNTLGKMGGLNDAQRDLFREKIAPALEIDHEVLIESASQRESLIDLHRNLTGQPVEQEEKSDSQRWWRFWK
jgi:hypothetical protein